MFVTMFWCREKDLTKHLISLLNSALISNPIEEQQIMMRDEPQEWNGKNLHTPAEKWSAVIE